MKRVNSTESTSSVASTSSQRLASGHSKDPGHEYATTAAVTTSYSRHLSDVCAVVIHCPKHDRFAMVPSSNHKGIWLPYVALRQSEGWYAAIVNKLRQLLNVKVGTKSSLVFTPPEVLHIMRIQLPEVLKYVTRVVFMTNLQSLPVASPSAANSSCIRSSPSSQPITAITTTTTTTTQDGLEKSKSNNKSGSGGKTKHTDQQGTYKCNCESQDQSGGSLKWLKHEQIVSDEDSLEIWGPEPGIFTAAFATNSVEKGAYSEYTLREAIRFQPHEQARNYQEEMLKSCHFERGDILRLYSDYVQHCFPSQNMNYVSFRDYMLKLGYEHHSWSQKHTTNNHTHEGSRIASPMSSSASSSVASSATGSSTGSGGGGPGVGTGTIGSSHHGSSMGQPSGLNVHNMRALYRAFKFNKMPYVTFHELLLGLAAMDRSTAHGGHVGELRCSYIFRYYDSNSNGQLGINDLKHMAYDRLRTANVKQIHSALKSGQVEKTTSATGSITGGTGTGTGTGPASSSGRVHTQERSKSASGSSAKQTLATAAAAVASTKIEPDSIQKELQRIYQQLNLKMGDSISEINFMLAVGSMQLRGTSNLFRSQISVLPVRQHYEVIAEKHALTDIEGNLLGTEIQRKGTCPRCKDKKYQLALHTVKLTHDAQVVEPTEVRFDEYPPPISRHQRQLSRIVFASDSTPNKLIDMITNYWNALAAAQISNQNQTGTGVGAAGAALAGMPLRLLVGTANAVPLGKTSWERLDRKLLAEDIRRICVQADVIFKQEARVVPVTSPCYVLGDIHGNLTDLRTYERILWPNAPTCVSGSYLFLGDYVDRGDYGLECIIYLLSMKVLAPKTFYLLRGNHELRSIQQAFTFFREVCEKFRNQALGIQVWETLNKTFDLMPVAATIDDQIYCAHGGIPTSSTRLDELYNIPTPLQDPENQSPAAWEILWNDPVSSTEYSEYADLLRKQPGGQQAVANMQGYLPNTKRGTAFFFSEEAVNRFLHLNNLSHIIRAHECVPPGYALHCNGKVITIFSSSHYCGATNDAACILVEREKLRIVRLDTD